ncbi:nucleolar protein 16-like [Actinia tenebrosa]|uniref:Nucleolar protein 16 n=1 Tax=Actinia tenebrosa TaxID=6105 RepID=A0A6P8J1P7_ACTTE|nr:nucleolar protein 16-like [Actinia tenebrosa]
MTGVRARRSRRNKKVNTTKPAKKRRNKQKKTLKIANKTIQKHWDESKTLKQNFKDLGLACDVNKSLPLVKKKNKSENEEVEKMDTENPTQVVQELEMQASNSEDKTERRIAPGEARFIWNLIQKYGNDFKAMARDKSNIYQHTPNQLKRKYEGFLRSSQDFSKHLTDSS